ncbi:MAG: hypothetical protein FIB07_15365 [Candidatus Methanoperedens sp.]|nr:hypothetical protein [Candidatus Methanoperedens sp.]
MIGLSEILIFIAGIVYGYKRPENDAKGNLLKVGFIYGLVLGAVIGILQSGIAGVLTDTVTFITLILTVGILFALFTLFGKILQEWKINL